MRWSDTWWMSAQCWVGPVHDAGQPLHDRYGGLLGMAHDSGLEGELSGAANAAWSEVASVTAAALLP
jgi:hypothetical protein